MDANTVRIVAGVLAVVVLGITQVDGLAIRMCAALLSVKAATRPRNCAPPEWPISMNGIPASPRRFRAHSASGSTRSTVRVP